MIQFIIAYWDLILGLIFFVLSFVIAVSRKKPNENILSLIYAACLDAVKYAEMLDQNDGLKGESKLNAALTFVFNAIKTAYPTIEVARYSNVIRSTIEEILETPQKK